MQNGHCTQPLLFFELIVPQTSERLRVGYLNLFKRYKLSLNTYKSPREDIITTHLNV